MTASASPRGVCSEGCAAYYPMTAYWMGIPYITNVLLPANARTCEPDYTLYYESNCGGNGGASKSI